MPLAALASTLNAVTIEGVTHLYGERSTDITICGLVYNVAFSAFPRRAAITCAKCLARTKGGW
jgi:hypothetical protein